jgi:spermidine/putrescine-binding protein
MNAPIGRRDLLRLGAGGLAGFAGMRGLAGMSAALAAEPLKGPFNPFIQCHTIGKAEDIALFKEQYHVDTNVTCWTSNTDTLTRFATGAGKTYDVLTISFQMIDPMIKRGLVAPLDWSKIPNTAKMMPQFQKPINSYVDGKYYSLPWCAGYDAPIYNKDVIPEFTSYAVLFDDKYAGKISLRDDPQYSIMMTALYMEKPNPAELSSKDLKEITDFLIKKKKNFRKLWTGFAEPIALLKSGDVVAINDGWIPMYRALKSAGVNVGHAYDVKEKAVAWTQDFMMPVEAIDRGMEDTVYAFMNWVISPEMTAHMGRTAGYVSPCGSGLSILSAAEQEDIGYSKVPKVWSDGFIAREFPANLQEWNDAWSRFKAA